MCGLYGDDTQYRMKRYGFRLYDEFFANPTADLQYTLMGRLRVATTSDGATELQETVEGGKGDIAGAKIVTGIDRDLVEYIPGNELTASLVVPDIATDETSGALYRPKVEYMESDSQTFSPRELAFDL